VSAPAIPPALNRGVFGWDAVRLSEAYTAAELARAITQLCADPANANPAHAAGRSIRLYTKATEKRADALGWAIFYIKQANHSESPNSSFRSEW
jgi:hypothetical protein